MSPAPTSLVDHFMLALSEPQRLAAVAKFPENVSDKGPVLVTLSHPATISDPIATAQWVRIATAMANRHTQGHHNLRQHSNILKKTDMALR